MKVVASNEQSMLGAVDRAIAVAKGSIADMQGLATPATIEYGKRDLQWLCEAFDKLEHLRQPATQESLRLAIRREEWEQSEYKSPLRGLLLEEP